MLKFRFIRTLSELVLLVFALNVIYDHLHELWVNQNSSWDKLMIYRWLPEIGAVVFVLLIIGFELFCIHMEAKEQEERDERDKQRTAIFLMIARAVGVPKDEPEKLMADKPSKKSKTKSTE